MRRALEKLIIPFRFLICWLYLGTISACFFPVFLVLWPSRRRRVLASNIYGQCTGRMMIFLSGTTLTPGLRAKLAAHQPAIFVSNHTSYLDIYFGIWVAPTGTLATAKRETALVPFLGQLYALSGNILINRASKRDAAAALHETIDLMQRFGTSVWIWPEGTRSGDGRLLPFKRGFAHVALATRLPIVPVVVSGAHRCWPRGRAYTTPADVRVQVLPPVPTTDWTLEKLDQHVADVEARFIAALPADQRPARLNRTSEIAM
ncbi:MAG: 1-acyl-sn-glycerol-3-phosphate acyltransferase [Verrucomicrobia bacterium]|nr:1-acyl-sn-glycerol-3-phosphate acyltransferase [Verrucomicrobiota bacterium]